jgi:predicted RND superfamily exporter protein
MNPTATSFDVAHLIQLAVGPVFLLAGVAATLNVLTSRLGRIVDRARPLELQLAGATDADERSELTERLMVMARRARYMNTALTLTTISGLLVAIVVLLLFFRAFLRADLSVATAIVFVASILCLVLALLSFLVEVRIATAALRIGPRP